MQQKRCFTSPLTHSHTHILTVEWECGKRENVTAEIAKSQHSTKSCCSEMQASICQRGLFTRVSARFCSIPEITDKTQGKRRGIKNSCFYVAAIFTLIVFVANCCPPAVSSDKMSASTSTARVPATITSKCVATIGDLSTYTIYKEPDIYSIHTCCFLLYASMWAMCQLLS